MAHEQVYRQVGRRLREAREGEGLTQEDVAKKLGMTKVAYGRYENAIRHIPVAELHKVAAIFGRPVHWFFGEDVTLEQLTSWQYQQLTTEEQSLIRDMMELLITRRRRSEAAA